MTCTILSLYFISPFPHVFIIIVLSNIKLHHSSNSLLLIISGTSLNVPSIKRVVKTYRYKYTVLRMIVDIVSAFLYHHSLRTYQLQVFMTLIIWDISETIVISILSNSEEIFIYYTIYTQALIIRNTDTWSK